MLNNIKTISQLSRNLNKLPGIGGKTSEKLALYLAGTEKSFVNELLESISNVQKNIEKCTTCYAYKEKYKTCHFCDETKRSTETICIVETIQDMLTINTTQFKGVFHVLHGIISPMDGISPEDIKLYELIDRIEKTRPKEIIMALNTNIESDATIMFISEKLKSKNIINIKISSLARGVPTGVNIDYVNEHTLNQAINERSLIKSKMLNNEIKKLESTLENLYIATNALSVTIVDTNQNIIAECGDIETEMLLENSQTLLNNINGLFSALKLETKNEFALIESGENSLCLIPIKEKFFLMLITKQEANILQVKDYLISSAKNINTIMEKIIPYAVAAQT